MVNIKYTDFTDDEEKMKDFHLLSKERFLESYSYLTEEEYDLTLKKFNLEQWFSDYEQMLTCGSRGRSGPG